MVGRSTKTNQLSERVKTQELFVFYFKYGRSYIGVLQYL